jgi:hypothetical protein
MSHSMSHLVPIQIEFLGLFPLDDQFTASIGNNIHRIALESEFCIFKLLFFNIFIDAECVQ